MNPQKIKAQIRGLFLKKPGDLPNIEELNHWYNSMNETTEEPHEMNRLRAESWRGIQNEIELSKAESSSTHGKRSLPVFRQWIWRAAILLIFCGSVYGMFSLLDDQPDQPVIASGSFTNDIGKISSFVLPDGSKVWLSTGSTVEYAEDFPRNRKVTLLGEAFFDVSHDPEFPFIVATGHVNTKVLGTSFNLKSYDQKTVELSVYSGRVSFSDQQVNIDSAVLLKGERISWETGKGLSEIEQFDLNQLPDWRSGRISFDHADLESIKSTLERWYNVEISLIGKGHDCHYSGEFTQSSLEHILQTLSYSLNLTYKINEDHVTIHANPC